MDRRDRVVALLRRLETWGHTRGWRGSDPYDGLNATRLVGGLRARPRGQRLLIQVVKRSPLDLRRPLGIEPGRNAAALASVVSAYARGGFLPKAENRRRLDATLDALESLRCSAYFEPCWGYHFDVRTRVFSYDRTTPNTIATAFAGLALLDAYAATGDPGLIDTALGTGRFFLKHVPQTPDGAGAFFGYLPGDRTPIHNANMLVAAMLARLSASAQGEGEAFREPARAALRWTFARQRPDGSWPYGERRNLAWIDNFHTGYVLDALWACAEAGLGSEAVDAWMRGLAFYRRRLFSADGAPLYTTRSRYPIDAQCIAQGIQTLALAGARDPACRAEAERVLDFAFARMLRRDGMPLFQRRRFWVNPTLHVRWVVSPMLLALTYLLDGRGTGAQADRAQSGDARSPSPNPGSRPKTRL
jgi:hypothetical protein